jgi:hypothetical protein
MSHLFKRSRSNATGLTTLLIWLGLSVLITRPTWAISQSALLLLTDPLSFPNDLRRLDANDLPADGSVLSANTISPDNLTIPSLWWARDQFGGKLLSNWLAYPRLNGSLRRVDLIVNQQVWSLYDYLDRYRFVNDLGTVAATFGFNTRVFNRNQDLLAAYICEPDTADNPQTVCNVFLSSSGAGSLRGRSGSLFNVAPATPGGTAQP